MTHSITGKTTICGLIGDPVEHSMSPAMHNAAFTSLGLDYAYLPFRVDKADLGKALDGMRALNMRGMNITIPHKVEVMQYLDALDPLAEKIGAVNTVVNDSGRLTGYNTDATGFLQPLIEKDAEPEGRNVVVIGAGGASRAISFMLADRKARLTIMNRREEFDWAVNLAAHVSEIFKVDVSALELNRGNLETALAGAGIVVNATSLGMSPNVDATPIPSELLRPGIILYDIVYNPLKTRLVREAEAAGAETVSGIDMLVWQGVLAFEKWTGQKPPREVMKKEAVKLL